MGNCLVTKLKEAVNNPDLPILGYLKIHVNATEQDSVDARTIRIGMASQSIETTRVYTDSNNLYIYGSETGVSEILVQHGITAITFGVGEYDVFVERYKFVSLRCSENNANIAKVFSIDLSQLDYTPCNSIYLTNCPVSGELKIGDVFEFALTTALNGIDNSKDNAILNLDIFNGRTLSVIACSCRNMKGAISSLSGISGNIGLTAKGERVEVTGDLTTFVNTMVANGVQNAVYTFSIANMNTTLYDNGNLFTNVYVNTESKKQGGNAAAGVRFTITNGVISKEWV